MNFDDYNKMYDITCNILSIFNGERGKQIVSEVEELTNKSPALRRFLYDFYYNIKSSDIAK